MGVTDCKREERRGSSTLKNSLETNLERKFSNLVPNYSYHEVVEARIAVIFSVWTNDKTVKINGVLSLYIVFENFFRSQITGLFCR